MTRILPVLVLLVTLALGISPSDNSGFGTRTSHECPGCIAENQRLQLKGLMKKSSVKSDAAAEPGSYTFYPHAGITTGGDLFLSNFTDMDSSGSYQDPFCGTRTYDGHRGVDTSILYWDQQDIGVPVFAALGGTVIGAHDGEFDRNTTWDGQPSNYVVIDHGNGHTTEYLHLKRDSVAVTVGQTVAAGQQIGSVGSSGISTGPHLHFATFVNGTKVEPFAGPCGPAQSLFMRQPEMRSPMYIRDFTITSEELDTWDGPPERPAPRGKFLLGTTSRLYFWINLVNMTNGAEHRIRILRPNGSVYSDNGTHDFPGIYNWSYWWWYWTINYNQLGTWKIEFAIDGEIQVEVPFEVVGSSGQLGNDPPHAQDVVFENPPHEDEVPVCRIENFTVLDDPDYDLVRFRYVWKVNNTVVRDVVSAALGDALGRSLIAAGDNLVCEVTPNDGVADGPTRSVAATVGGVLLPEIDIEEPVGTSLTNGETRNFGNVAIGTSPQKTFTIRNTGNGDLTGLGVSIDGTGADAFEVSSIGQTTLAVGQSTSFTLTCSPTSTGTKNAAVHVTSNDPDENPFDIPLIAFGMGPEIEVEQPAGSGLSDGGSSDFGDIAVGASSQKTFTIRNAGNSNLTGLNVSIGGADAAMFQAGGPGQTSLAPDATTTFTVTCRPTSAGNRTASLQIASNDFDENPFDLTLLASGNGPEIEVEEPAGSALSDGGTLDFGNIEIDESSQKTVTIRNTGNGNLTGLTVSLDGPDASLFQAGAPGATTLAPAESTTFTLTCTPDSTGSKTAALHIGSNDYDENPFDLALSAFGATPEIEVEEPAGNGLTDGSSIVDFGAVVPGASGVRTFRIRNAGTAVLGGLSTSVSGTHAAEFDAGSPGLTQLNPGQATTFTVAFQPSAAGQRDAQLRIASNDADENPFDITLRGTGADSQMALEQPVGTPLVSGESIVAFEAIEGDSPTERFLVFRLKSTGDAPLGDISGALVGAQSDQFVLGALPSEIAAGSHVHFSITFRPTSTGEKSATLRINSDAAGQDPFEITVRGVKIELTDLESWSGERGLQGDQARADADGDGDFVSLLEEFAYNLDPGVRDSTVLEPGTGTRGLPLIRVVDGRLQIEFLRRTNDPDLVYHVEFGADLSGTMTAATEAETVQVIDGEFERVLVNDSETTGSSVARFGRVRLEYHGPGSF